MRLILVTLLSLCSSCASNPDAQAHRLALWNFTYEADEENEYRIYNSISVPFTGDCEDYAFTLQGVVGGSVWYVARGGRQAHAVLVKDGLVYDSLSRYVVKKELYQGEFIFIMKP